MTTTLQPTNVAGESDECEGELEAPAPKRPVSLPVITEHGERVEPEVRGEAVLRLGESAFQRLDRWLEGWLPVEQNPFAQTGAIANVSLILAVASGIALLLWYSTSVHRAHASVVAMTGVAGFVRNLHRYSSDACMLFVLLHALKLFFARRFGGARWLAWVTGLVLVGLLWLVGWLGYWLVWDQRGQQVALGTARMLDALPVFADPLSRSFLADDKLNSLLFFVVFFVHMLLPLAMGIALWLHITRLSRPWFLTRGKMTWWVVGSLALVSLLFPADHAGPARMAEMPSGFALDGWYLAPLALTDRLGAAALWSVVLVGGALLFPIPWLLAKGRARTAHVIASRCNACEKCYRDCPYDAIQMVPRSDGRSFPSIARLDPRKCIGCGICAGSCDSAGVGIDWFDSVAQRRRVDELVAAALARAEEPWIAFLCAESAGARFAIDPATGACPALPGYLAVRLPCAGWLHPLTVERALRRGARGVLVVACGPSGCLYREGGRWTRERMEGRRAPALRPEKAAPEKVQVLELFRSEAARLSACAEAFRAAARSSPAAPGRQRRWVAGLALAAVLGLVTWAASRVGYASPVPDAPLLIVSFKHPGKAAEGCREPTADELKNLPKHMRAKQICERRRIAVRLRVTVDGREQLARSYPPRGVWGDGNSIAVERIPLPPGRHDVRVELGDTPDTAELNHSTSRQVTLTERHNTVLVFDKLEGFQWYE